MGNNVKLTPEEKAEWGPLLCGVWHQIAPDAEPLLSNGRGRLTELVELVCDANRPSTNGGLTDEEEKVLYAAYSHRDTQRWLRQTLGGYA